MFSYIYYGYLTGYTFYKVYEYWDFIRTGYSISKYAYKLVKKPEKIELTDFRYSEKDSWIIV